MKVRNYSPFPWIFFESQDPSGKPFGVMLVKGTFRIVPGEMLQVSPRQDKICTEDRYSTDSGRQVLLYESDLAPFKPKTDIIVDAFARSSEGVPQAELFASLKAGLLERKVKATGKRFWKKEDGEWVLTEPEPISEVPIRFDHAFGGTWGEEEQQICSEFNPAGIGFWPPDEAQINKELWPAPQLEKVDGEVLRPTNEREPISWGPVPKHWLPRRKYSGTIDVEKPQQTLPMDFDYHYYNAAHPSLIYPKIIDSNETFQLCGIHPSNQDLSFQLPNIMGSLLIRKTSGAMPAAPMFLDTVYISVLSIDPEEWFAHLSWRGVFDVSEPVRVLEARMFEPEPHEEQVKHGD